MKNENLLVKQFNESTLASETKIQDWLNTNQSIEIVNILQNALGVHSIFTTIWYFKISKGVKVTKRSIKG